MSSKSRASPYNWVRSVRGRHKTN